MDITPLPATSKFLASFGGTPPMRPQILGSLGIFLRVKKTRNTLATPPTSSFAFVWEISGGIRTFKHTTS